jgi:hypothetical protein
MYTDDVNAQIVLALLKKYNIRKIVVSPGTTNVPIARSVQFDPFFEVYSMVDERGAAYFAGGLAYASGEPVVISCTGATASRDYLPGLTEAYYRHLPVIALTSQHTSSTYHDLVPQMTDRTVSQNDVKKYSAQLPSVRGPEDFKLCARLVNEALIAATTNGGGPVQTLLETYLPTVFPAFGNHLRDDHYKLFAREDEMARRRYERDLLRMIRQLYNYPCIGQWVPFNEGWGQFDSLRITDRIKKEDPTRPVDHASGWFDQGGGDVRSVHNYFRPLTVKKERRAFVISEYGGINCQIGGHSMN